MKQLYTTLGTLFQEDIQYILPHEHTFVDLRHPDVPDFAQADENDFIATVSPEIEALKSQGASLLIDCAPMGVGRRVDLIKALSQSTNFPIMVPTGIYREPWIPDWAKNMSLEALTQWMLKELKTGIEDTGVLAGFIKISAGDDGMSPLEEKILRAACLASIETGAVIGSHTIHGSVVLSQVAVMEEMGLDLSRFIWIHAHREDDFSINLDLAAKGVWIEYDGIGWEADDPFIDRIHRFIDAGFLDQLLISQDHGWYEPAKGTTSVIRPYTYLMDHFIPNLRSSGIADAAITKIFRDNPVRAFAR